jgi:hypothetical protein
MKDVLFRPLHLVDVGRISDEELRQNTWLSVLELTMKHVYDTDIFLNLEIIIEALHKVEQQGGLRFIEGALTYLINTVAISKPGHLLKPCKRVYHLKQENML